MTSPEETEPRTWYARVVCPVCYGPVRVRSHEKEGRCRTHRPVRQHSKPRPSPSAAFARLLAEHQ